jgi:hypothetical protein
LILNRKYVSISLKVAFVVQIIWGSYNDGGVFEIYQEVTSSCWQIKLVCPLILSLILEIIESIRKNLRHA